MKYIVVALLLVGCSHNQTKTVSLPDGTQGLAVQCNGTRSSITDCMNTAAAECGGRYEIITQDGGSPGGLYVPNGTGGGMVMNAVRRSLVVKCQ